MLCRKIGRKAGADIFSDLSDPVDSRPKGTPQDRCGTAGQILFREILFPNASLVPERKPGTDTVSVVTFRKSCFEE